MRSRRTVGLAAAVLVLGLTGGGAAAAGLATAADDASSEALALRTATVRTALDTTFQRYTDTVHDLVAVAGTSPSAGLSTTVDRLVGERLVGAHQVLIVRADRTVVARHSVDSSTPPATTVLHPVPELARAMELAERSGRPVAGPAHVLPADADLPPERRQAAFDLAAPVHGPAFRGWVVVSVRATDLLDTALRAAGVTGVTTVLTENSPDGVPQEVARWSQGGDAVGDRRESLEIPLAGAAWQVTVRPTTPLVTVGRTVAAPVTMLAAILLSLALGAVVLAAGTARDRAGQRARAAAEDAAAAGERARHADLIRRERESELTGFATTAGRNLHAPLHTIAGFTELLLQDAAPRLDEASRGFLHRIDGAARRMLTLVDELLAYTGTIDAALKPEPVETSMLALDVVADRLHAPGPRPDIDLGELPAVSGDAMLLHQVLTQLVDNAVRFVRHGTAARITIGSREQPGDWWRIEVADRGIGVPQEHRERIFAPFHRAPAAEGYPGSGLGLAVCARIVALHGGEIGVEANPGGGSVFWFTMPGAGLVAHQPALA
jgi:signal transduction histidine kinase